MRFRILSLNVWGLPWPVGRDLSARMRALGEALPGLDVDVASLQEVWTPGARAVLVAAGREAGLAHVWHRPSAWGGSGLLVLSRLPIARARFEPFGLGGLPEKLQHGDYWGGKGFALLTLATDAGEITLLDTHLQASYAPRLHDGYRWMRVGQVVELAERVREVRRPLVAAGDFNFADHDEEYAVLTGLTGLRDTAARLGRREDTILASNPYRSSPPEPSKRIDYLFYRDGAERGVRPLKVERVLDGRFEIDGHAAAYSDHSGLRAEFEVADGAAPLPPVDPAAAALARRLLLRGREQALRRRHDLRLGGAAGLLAAPFALTAARRTRLTRRRFVRACAVGGAGLAAVYGAGCLGLADGLAPDEVAGFDASLEQLERLAG